MLHNVILGRSINAVHSHTRAELAFEILHTLPGAAHSHRAAQFIGLCAGKVSDRHRNPQQLFLKKRHAKSSLQDRLKRRVGICDFLSALSPPHVGVHHLADDGAGPDNRYLHNKIVKTVRVVSRQ